MKGLTIAGACRVLAAVATWVVAFPASFGYANSPVRGLVQPASRYFAETGHTVRGRFLEYWQANGGLPQQGYPITDELQEVSPVDGKSYTVQYFERAVFERHPENPAPYDVLLSLLGVFEYQDLFGAAGPAGQTPSTDSPVFFPETGKSLGGMFRLYWEAHGGLPQQGYPISNEFQQTSQLDDKIYRVQYFERAVFEYHPENAGTPYEVLLSQLGTIRYRATYQSLHIPAPARGRRQMMPQGSDSYLVWREGSPPEGGNENYDLFALDLKANRSMTVSDAPGDQLASSISGSVVVWEDNRHSCSTCDFDVLGKDLATGRDFQVATGPNDQVFPAIAGKKVAWVEASHDALRLLIKDIDSSESYEAQSIPLKDGMGYGLTFGKVALSEEFLVWAELAAYSRDTGQVYEIKAMDLNTHEVRSVFKGRLDIIGASDDLSVSGHRVVYSIPEVQMTDLSTGESRTLFAGGASSARIRGDIVVWLAQSRIWGVNVGARDVKARQLVGEPVRQGDYGVSLAIAGDWLVWNNAEGRQAGTLSAKRLNEAFGGPTP